MERRKSMNKILTVPSPRDGKAEEYLATGNEYVSIPHVDPNGAIERIGVIRLDCASLIEFAGGSLACPYVARGGVKLRPSALQSGYESDWLPCIKADYGQFEAEYILCAPAGNKGFVYKARLRNKSGDLLALRSGISGRLEEAIKTVYHSRPLNAEKCLYHHEWTDTLIFELDGAAALGISADSGFHYRIDNEELSYEIFFDVTLEPGGELDLSYYFSVNTESDGAAAVNIDLRRRTGDGLLTQMKGWLAKRRCSVSDAKIGSILNRNLFFCLFYSTARTIDTEELVLMTSRSSKYYVSAAFWSRDSLLWSFPGLLLADRELAREALLLCFTKYIRNAGIHSLYINGAVLYPGFELDELAAYIIALKGYVQAAGDTQIMNEPAVKDGIRHILSLLDAHFDPGTGLYETELDPSDDPARYPFLTYDNAVVMTALRFLSAHGYDTGERAKALESAIWAKCVIKTGSGGRFAWSTDGHGSHEAYDDPPGSLTLLAYYGFCSAGDEVYANTVRWIFSDGNPYYYGQGAFA
ncbi:MAG: glycoside hydrolase family 125 protein, partial [Clostridia bacterium]|nr:glycoside hydrolase family 125 protein [Clostridia bacterium]